MLTLEGQNSLREKYRQANPGWRPATEVYADLVRSYLKRHSRLLDLGCGRGGLVEQLDFPLSQAVGTDSDWFSLAQHRLGAKKPPFPRVAAFGQRLPFSDETFDIVIASWVLEHLGNPADDFREISRVLRPNGVFIFITPNRNHPATSINRFVGRFAGFQTALVRRFYGRRPADTFPTYYRANTVNDLRQLARASSLQTSCLKSISDPTYLAFTTSMFRFSCWLDSHLSDARQIHLVGCLATA
jgi:SAM-dependent methyltransferase